jgi:large subunit ribosomal protein L4
MWQVVKAYLANQRQGTAATKTRADVKGGSKKPWRQKGTGRARQGSIRAPQWRGGGNVFGPRANRNFRQDVPKQVKWLARRSAYNVRAQDGGILLIDAAQFDVPKTKRMAELLAALGVPQNAGVNVLLLTDGYKPLVHRSSAQHTGRAGPAVRAGVGVRPAVGRHADHRGARAGAGAGGGACVSPVT